MPENVSFVATVGFFDGVHIGHRYLVEQLKREAGRCRLPSAVITFPVHPRKVLQKDYQPALLSGFEEKVALLATTGIDYCVVLPFTPALSELSADVFMRRILKERLHVDTLLVGYDHRFGYQRSDGFPQYEQYGRTMGIRVLQAEELLWNVNFHVSSSQIRRLLKEGRVEEANHLLSYRYTLSGKIVEGYRVGRTIGFPTANLQSWERYKVIPRLGVYAVLVSIDHTVYKGMLYIGTRPTLRTDEKISVEVNLFDFEGDLYDRTLTVTFVDYIRSDKKFDNIDQLVRQIYADKKAVIQRLERIESTV